MYGIIIAFEDFKPHLGYLGSPYVGLKHFARFFGQPDCWQMISNTLILSVEQLIFSFPIPILLALAINQLNSRRYQKTVQVITYAPHFISMVVLVSIMRVLLDPQSGVVNHLLQALGKQPIFFMGDTEWFRRVYVGSEIWQNTGWNSVIYFAALASVDVSMHEAAIIDGASKLQRVRYIDFPSILPTIITVLILNTGKIMSIGFEKVYAMQNALNLSTSQIISTYVYQVGIREGQYSYSAAINLFNSVINLILLLTVVDGAVALEWLPVEGAAGYRVVAGHRGESVGFANNRPAGTPDPLVLPAHVTQACFEGLQNGVDYEVSVFALDDKGKVMERSLTRLFSPGAFPGEMVNYLHPKDYMYAFSGRSTCSPFIIRLPSGALLCSHDIYWRNDGQNLTILLRSEDGRIGNLLRYHTRGAEPDYGVAVLLPLDPEHPEEAMRFEQTVALPGNYTKFHVQHDGERYLMLLNRPTEDCHWRRDILSLAASEDGRTWRMVCDLIDESANPEGPTKVGFQYPSFIVEGSDLLCLSRTALNGAFNYHNANAITFHRVENYRALLRT